MSCYKKSIIYHLSPWGKGMGKGCPLGNISIPFNTAGMYRGSVTSEREPQVAIYGPGQ